MTRAVDIVVFVLMVWAAAGVAIYLIDILLSVEANPYWAIRGGFYYAVGIGVGRYLWRDE